MILMLGLFPIADSADQSPFLEVSCSYHFPTILILLVYLDSLFMCETKVCFLVYHISYAHFHFCLQSCCPYVTCASLWLLIFFSFKTQAGKHNDSKETLKASAPGQRSQPTKIALTESLRGKGQVKIIQQRKILCMIL
jgi:hypothetical protein